MPTELARFTDAAARPTAEHPAGEIRLPSAGSRGVGRAALSGNFTAPRALSVSLNAPTDTGTTITISFAPHN